MPVVTLDDLTKLTTPDGSLAGTGVFDVLMGTVNVHIQKQYDDNRLSGTEFAQVYLGALQATLAQSVAYLTAFQQAEMIAEQVKSEIKNNEVGGLIDLQKQKLQEEIDLVIAQTAGAYENIKATTQDTVRQNALNTKQVIKVAADTDVSEKQALEIARDTLRKDAESTSQVLATDAGAALKSAQITEINLESLRKDSESEKKVVLMQAQADGFGHDAKSKLLKQMTELFSVGYSVKGNGGTIPEAAKANGIDTIVADLFEKLSVNASAPNVPPTT